jgi:hypothetical protein
MNILGISAFPVDAGDVGDASANLHLTRAVA